MKSQRLKPRCCKTKAELKAAEAHAARTNELAKTGAVSQQLAEDNLTNVESAKAAVNAAKARLTAADATIEASRAQYYRHKQRSALPMPLLRKSI